MKGEPAQPAPDSFFGTVLQAARVERGLTLAQASAATRLRAAHLVAIEAGQLDGLPAPVYARGYVRTYARYLGLDPESIVAMMPRPPASPRRWLDLTASTGRRTFVITAPVAVVAVFAILASGFAVYGWRQINSLNTPTSPAPHVAAILATTPLPSTSPQVRPIVVGIRVTDSVWLTVTVDGVSQYSDSGRILPAGTQVIFTGLDIKITSGKGAATFITIDNRPIGAMGSGVVTREFKGT